MLTGNGSTAAGVFSNLTIAGRITLGGPLTTTGALTLAPGSRLELNGQPLIVGGQLITNATTGTLPLIVGGAGSSFIVTGVNVNGLVLNGAPLTINGAPLTRFDNVSFSGFAPEAIQLTVNNPGLLTAFPMNGVSFASQPTSGHYISASDTQPGGALLVLDVTGAVPTPGLVIEVRGELDNYRAMSRQMADRLGAKVELFDGLGHWWMVQDPAESAASLKQFWASVPSPGTA